MDDPGNLSNSDRLKSYFLALGQSLCTLTAPTLITLQGDRPKLRKRLQGLGAKEWAVRDSNPRHPACKAGALPTELTARFKSCKSVV